VEHLEAAVKLNPGPLSSCSLGVAYASKAKQDRGRQDEASYKESVGRVIAVFQKAIEQGLETMEVHSNLGIAFQQGGERAAAASSSKRQ
jgi:ABC-type uncharacterized transport system ATPase component